MSELMQSEVMPHESEVAQSEDAAPMSEVEIGNMFDAPEESEQEPEQQEEVEEQEAVEATPDEPAIPAPANWADADKEEFNRLPRAMQEKIATRERERDAYLTRKSQEIAEKSRSVQSLEALGEALRNDPGLKAHLAAYQKQPAAEAPSDPIDRIAWEAEQRAVAKVNEQLGPIIQQLQQHNRVQETLSAVKQDEHHKEVYAEIEKLLKAMPPEDAKTTYQRLDTDPDYFARTYDYYRAQVVARPKVAPTPATPAAPTPVDRKTKAPLLETPGAEQPDTSKKKRFSDLKSRAYGGDTAALGALFDF